MNQTFFRNIFATMDVFDDPTTLVLSALTKGDLKTARQNFMDNPIGSTMDSNFNMHSYDGNFNRIFEATTRFLGFTTIRAAEERALQSYIRSSDRKKAALRSSFIDQAATAQQDTDAARGAGGLTQEAIRIMEYAALKFDITISPDDILKELEARLQDPVERTIQGRPGLSR